jgi:hypothetical protein
VDAVKSAAARLPGPETARAVSELKAALRAAARREAALAAEVEALRAGVVVGE